MKKWSKAATARKAQLDEREELASDLEVLIAQLRQLPPGQLKKVLTEDVCAVLRTYGVEV